MVKRIWFFSRNVLPLNVYNFQCCSWILAHGEDGHKPRHRETPNLYKCPASTRFCVSNLPPEVCNQHLPWHSPLSKTAHAPLVMTFGAHRPPATKDTVIIHSDVAIVPLLFQSGLYSPLLFTHHCLQLPFFFTIVKYQTIL